LYLSCHRVDEHLHDQTCKITKREISRVWAHNPIEQVVANDCTLVTHNSVDFRGQGPGSLDGEHAKQPIHAGLICLNSALIMDLDRQLDLFQLVLQELASLNDLVNQAMEVFELEDGTVELEIYDIPEPSHFSGV